MDPSFTQAIAELRMKQEQANKQHRIAMAYANTRLATLGQEHAQVMSEADLRLKNLGHEQRAAENDQRLRMHVRRHEREIAEADRRLKSLGSESGSTRGGSQGRW
ncbi:hypothetical protein F5Y19DRAFT_258942 [Xylariaceae sp. FL1651]|nr:hypothetical protein F5Y19DRAFT_258942 [Xylariaceae sp. FL1651]